MIMKILGLVIPVCCCFACCGGVFLENNPNITNKGVWVDRNQIDRCEKQYYLNPDQMLSRAEEIDKTVVLVDFVDRDGMRRQIILREIADSGIELLYLIPHGDEIRKQMGNILEKQPEMELDQVCDQVRIARCDKWKIDGGAIREMVGKIEVMNISPIIESPIVLEGIIYNVWTFRSGGVGHFSFFDRSDTDVPLQAWIEELVRLVNSNSMCRRWSRQEVPLRLVQ